MLEMVQWQYKLTGGQSLNSEECTQAGFGPDFPLGRGSVLAEDRNLERTDVTT